MCGKRLAGTKETHATCSSSTFWRRSIHRLQSAASSDGRTDTTLTDMPDIERAHLGMAGWYVPKTAKIHDGELDVPYLQSMCRSVHQ